MAASPDRAGLRMRLFNRRVGAMLVRNTVVSCGVFAVGLGILYALVRWYGFPEVPAAGVGFVIGNTLHYALGRAWIFRGTDRGRASGYAYFLLNATVGLVVTLALFAALLAWTPMNYLIARVVVSVFAGLIVFGLNAVLNFKRV